MNKKNTPQNVPAVKSSKALAAKPKPRSLGKFKPGSELSAAVK